MTTKTVTLPNGRTVQLEPSVYRDIAGVAARCGWDMGQLVFEALHRWAVQDGTADGLSSCALRQVVQESQRHGLTPQEYLRIIDYGPHQ
jgi:hypothetical protein